MRIIGGKYKGRRIDPPKGIEARPTTDYAKEGLFNILQHSVPLEGIRMLDLFAGTGNISLEFLSRGAESALSVEQDRTLFTYQQALARKLEEPNWHMVKADVFSFLATHRVTYDIIFADPPFRMEGYERIPTLVRDGGLLAEEGLLIVEHPGSVDLSADPWFWKHRPYGNVHFTFLRRPDPSNTNPDA